MRNTEFREDPVEAVTPAGASGNEQTYTLDDIAGQPRKRFTGTHLAFVSTGGRKPARSRWLTLDLYRKSDGSYVLHRTGYSVVYHDVNGCGGGEKLTLPELLEETDEGVPCPDCRPRPFSVIKTIVKKEPDTQETVSLERVYYKVLELKDVPELLEALKFVPRDSRTGLAIVSRPGQELLWRSAEHDEKIAALSDGVQDI
jgi:hypothetical protein